MIATHTGHDANITFVKDSQLFSLESERVVRIKHWSKVSPIFEEIIKENNIKIISSAYPNSANHIYTEFNEDFKLNAENEIRIGHHLCHAAYSYYTKPSSMKTCDILIHDGWGYETDRYFLNKDLELIDSLPNGLGLLWNYISRHYYNEFKQEGKLMGLSAYGVLKDNLYHLFDIFLEYIQKSTSAPDNERKRIKEEYYSLGSKYLTSKLHGFEMKDVARSLQEYSEILVINYLKKKKTCDNLIIGGGIGLNGYINQRIINEGIYKNIHIPPAVSDTGLSVGAFLLTSKMFETKQFVLGDIKYLGKEFKITSKILGLLDGLQVSYKKLEYSQIYNIVAEKIANGAVIAWYQGRSESGPRALGNRSLLADPRSSTIKDYINDNIKHREWYRPYAPSILLEYVDEWFENVKESQYMLRIAKYKEGKGELVPAVCHIDYTGRVQTVSEKDNKKFYNLIKAFYKKTSVPILLNTSFNVQEPIVDSPEDAIKTFISSKIDILVLHNYIIEKENK